MDLNLMFLILLVLLGVLLFYDYQKDSGEHRLIKLLHFVGLYLLSAYSLRTFFRTFNYLANLIGLKTSSLPVPDSVSLYSILGVDMVIVAFCLVKLYFVYKLTQRSVNALKWIIKLIPVFMMVIAFRLVLTYVKMYLQFGPDMAVTIFNVWTFSFISILVLYFILYLFYKSRQVALFFKTDPVLKIPEDNRPLDDSFWESK